MPGKVLYFMLLATVLALAVVWENAALRQAGYRLEKARAAVAEQRAQRIINQAHLSKLRNPQRILALVKWLGLDLRERTVPAVDATNPAEGVAAASAAAPRTRVTAGNAAAARAGQPVAVAPRR